MNYEINPKVYQNTFGIPVEIVENHIKLASHSALKVIIYIMRKGIDSIENNATTELGISDTELNESLLYWAQVGLLTKKGSMSPTDSTTFTDSPVVVRNEHPNRTEVARRLAESNEIAHVMRQAEVIFGRSLKPAEMSTIVYIMDNLNIKASVTLMLLQYANAENKLTPAFLESTATRWANEGITSVHSAEKELQKAEVKRTSWRVVCRAMGIEPRRPSKNEEEASLRWVNEWAFSDKMLCLAYDECVDHLGKLSIPYINTTLENWHKSGIDTPDKIKDANYSSNKPAKPSKKKNPATSDNPSFDIDLFEQLLNKKGD